MVNPTNRSLKVVEASSSVVARRMPHCPGQYIIADDGGVFYDPSNSASIKDRMNLSFMGASIVSDEVFTITSDTPAGLYMANTNFNIQIVGNDTPYNKTDPAVVKLRHSVARGGCLFISKSYSKDFQEMIVSIPYGSYIDLAWAQQSTEGTELEASAAISYSIKFSVTNEDLYVNLVTTSNQKFIKRI